MRDLPGLFLEPFSDELGEYLKPAFEVYRVDGFWAERGGPKAGDAQHDAMIERQLERLRASGDDASALMFEKNLRREYERYLKEQGDTQSQIMGDPEVQRLEDFGKELQKAIGVAEPGDKDKVGADLGGGPEDQPTVPESNDNKDDAGPPPEAPSMTIAPPD